MKVKASCETLHSVTKLSWQGTAKCGHRAIEGSGAVDCRNQLGFFYETQVVPQRQSNLIRMRHAGFLHRRVIYLSHEGSDYFETAALIDVNQ